MKKYCHIILPLAIHLFLLSQFRFTAWPEMLSFPYLWTHGFDLYKDMVHVYPPFLTYFLAGIYKLFGGGVFTLKIFFWLVTVFNDAVIYQLVTKLTKSHLWGIFALAIYIPLQFALEGNMLWFDTFLLTPMLLSALFILRKNYFGAFLFWSIAILTKQTALIFAPVYIYFLYQAKSDIAKLRGSFLGLMPVFAFVICLLLRGDLTWFLNWNFIYPTFYWKNYPGYYQLSMHRNEFLIVALLFLPSLLKIKSFKQNIMLPGFLVLSFLAFYPRFSFFHLQVFIAFSVIQWTYLAAKYRFFSLFAIVSTLAIVWLRTAQLKWDWQGNTRFYEPETAGQAALLKKVVSGSRVYYLNLPSHYYILTNSYPPKPWVDNYGWYWEVPGFQQAVLDRWSLNPPEIVVWQSGGYEPQEVTRWIRNNYNSTSLEGEINIWQKKEN